LQGITPGSAVERVSFNIEDLQILTRISLRPLVLRKTFLKTTMQGTDGHALRIPKNSARFVLPLRCMPPTRPLRMDTQAIACEQIPRCQTARTPNRPGDIQKLPSLRYRQFRRNSAFIPADGAMFWNLLNSNFVAGLCARMPSLRAGYISSTKQVNASLKHLLNTKGKNIWSNQASLYPCNRTFCC
jgi:hypothetical protein